MKNQILKSFTILTLAVFIIGCGQTESKKSNSTSEKKEIEKEILIVNSLDSNGIFEIKVKQGGRYRISFRNRSTDTLNLWLEDYIDNKNDRQYNVTGMVQVMPNSLSSIDGSPLAEGSHKMKVHLDSVKVIKSITFELVQSQFEESKVYTQNMEGDEWDLVWSDEFDGTGLVDNNKWNYNIGDWGWGNNELQYYTLADTKNARQENGNLIIEAHPTGNGKNWTSARLTTQGKAAFVNGRIEFRAKVPHGLGTWAAGWLLGDEYKDELSWPYCGEIDVLECVGYEIDSLGNGTNHGSCHTPAYYFKKNNHITGTIDLTNMTDSFHTYAIEWYKDKVVATLDDSLYYTYDKTANELEWPFKKPQNIIVNLAIGGGWGGAKGVNQDMGPQQYILDYVRVYQKK